MDIPKQIKIGAREVEVRIAPIEGNFMGLFIPETQMIVLNETNSKMAMIETFWHELIHAINDFNRVDVELAMEMEAMNTGAGGDPEMRAGMMEERMTENFAQVFLQVITDNNLLNIKP